MWGNDDRRLRPSPMMTTSFDHPSTALNIFEKFEVGVIHLDAQRSVLAMNDFARSCLPVREKQPFDKMVLSFHTERAKPKVAHMLDAAEGCMIINVPEQVLRRSCSSRSLA